MNPSKAPLVDTHCHLTWPNLLEDLDGVLARMEDAGVRWCVCVGVDLESSAASRDLAQARPGVVYATAGVHPNDVPADVEAAARALERLLASGGFVGVGETGIDLYRDRVPLERQLAAFRAHASFARRFDLALVVHLRDRKGSERAFELARDVIDEFAGGRTVLHCFSGDAAWAARFSDLGCYVSFSGIVTYPNAPEVRDAAAAVPPDRLLVETDAPFLAPQRWRGRRNEPAYVAETARVLAEVRGEDEAELRERTTRNAERVFRVEKGDGSA